MRGPKPRYRLLSWTLPFLLVACAADPQPPYTPTFSDRPLVAEPVYLFGVHPLHNPQRLFEVFGPLMAYLSDQIEGARFQLEASRNYAAYEEKLYSGRLHFALPNPLQTIGAIDCGYQVFAKMGDDHNFRGILLIRQDSDIRVLSDLKGRSISYPAPTALAATILPQQFLREHGIDVERDMDNRYVGSQESSIMNVYLGHTDVAATWPPPWQALSRERPELVAALEVKWETAPLINNGLVASPQVPSTIVAAVRELLIGLHTHEKGRHLLTLMALSRFEPAEDRTYQVVRDFLGSYARNIGQRE